MSNTIAETNTDSIATAIVATESNKQHSPRNTYSVPILAHLGGDMVGFVLIDAMSHADAVAKVQVQIDAATIDPNLEMEELESGYTLSYGDVIQAYDCIPEILENWVEVEPSDEAGWVPTGTLVIQSRPSMIRRRNCPGQCNEG